MAKLKILSLVFLLSAVWHMAAAQSDPLDEKLNKALALVEDDKYDDADAAIEKLLKKHPEYGHGWDELAQLRYKEYLKAKKEKFGLGGNIKVTTKDKDGNAVPVEDDTLAQKLAQMLNTFSPAKTAYSKFMYTMRMGTLLTDDAYGCSALLRAFNIDPEVDTNVSRKAIKYFNQGEEAFEAHNYNTAAQLYRRAIEENPDFYKARLYLGDVYYATKDYANAIPPFRDAADKFPDLMEPHKYLTDAYLKLEMYDQAIEEAIKSLIVYPDCSMVVRVADALYLKNKKLQLSWVKRDVLPSRVPDKKPGEIDLSVYTEKEPMEATGIWVSYQKAGNEMIPHCNSKGIITDRSASPGQRYLEVYCWEQMLKDNPTDPALEGARRAQKMGNLDCYVLVTQFHYDFYEQYKEFVGRNKDRVLKYYHDNITYKD